MKKLIITALLACSSMQLITMEQQPALEQAASATVQKDTQQETPKFKLKLREQENFTNIGCRIPEDGQKLDSQEAINAYRAILETKMKQNLATLTKNK